MNTDLHQVEELMLNFEKFETALHESSRHLKRRIQERHDELSLKLDRIIERCAKPRGFSVSGTAAAKPESSGVAHEDASGRGNQSVAR